MHTPKDFQLNRELLVTGVPRFDRDAASDPLLGSYRRALIRLHGAGRRTALEDIEALADRGSVMSCLLIADAKRDGWIYKQDLQEAEHLYRMMIDAGSIRAWFELGHAYRMRKNYPDSIRAFERARSLGFPAACNMLAGMYYRGEGVDADRLTAMQLWREGASLGHLPSRLNLSRHQVRGHYGLWGWLEGLANLIPAAHKVVRAKHENPYSDRLR